MKAITIHQPWATLLVTGEKLYETRSWHTAHRGRLLVHAAKKFTEDMRLMIGMDPFYQSLSRHGIAKPEQLPKGKIVGMVTLEACIPTEELELDIACTNEQKYGDFRPGRLAWKMSQPIAFENPVSYQGKLGLFESSPRSIGRASQGERMQAAWCHTLKHAGGQRLLTVLGRLDRRKMTAAVAFDELMRYVSNNVDRMDYPRYLKNGWQIVSGAVESACKTVVNQRLCLGGMRWGDDGSDAVAHLRALHRSDIEQWDEFWAVAA